MNNVYKLFLILCLIFPFRVSAQGDSCASAHFLCLPDNASSISYPVTVNGGSAEVGNYYGCLATQPNPAWFSMIVSRPGNIELHLVNPENRDIDFACWGPFTEPIAPCFGLFAFENLIDCSYSTSGEEWCYIPDAQPGEVYLLLVTSFSNSPGSVIINQPNANAAGSGSGACVLYSDSASSNSPVCRWDTLFLNAPLLDSATYSWYGPQGFISHDPDPAITCIEFADEGTYTVCIKQGDSTSIAGMFVDVLPLLEAEIVVNSMVEGLAGFVFRNPTDSNIVYFGDGTFMENLPNEAATDHQYDSCGLYLVKYISFYECGSDTVERTVLAEYAGLNDHPLHKIKLSPNPTTGKCGLEGISMKDITLVECSSIDGKRLYFGTAPGLNDGSNTVMDFSLFRPGIYVLTIHTPENSYTVRVVRSAER